MLAFNVALRRLAITSPTRDESPSIQSNLYQNTRDALQGPYNAADDSLRCGRFAIARVDRPLFSAPPSRRYFKQEAQ
jgi:hypothetical protein